MTDLDSAQLEKFWSMVDRKGDDECWPWLRNNGGTPTFLSRGKADSALRIMYELHYDEEVDPEMRLLRVCGTLARGCVNPHHMVVVKRGITLGIWRRQRIRAARGSVHELADLAGYELVPVDSGHYQVISRQALV